MEKIDFSLNSKIALVTGSSRGIGEAIAITLSDYGAHCLLVSRKAEWSRIITTSQRFSDETPGAFRAYLYQIARNLLIDRSRRATLHLVEVDDPPEVASDVPSPDEQLHYHDCGEQLLLAIDGLPVEQREAFLLKEQSGLSLEQIAALVSAGHETIKSRLRYAMKKLRQLLEDCL